MTRKERKRKRKHKKFVPLGDEEKAQLKAIGRRMSEYSHPDLGTRFHCKTCDQGWEHAYDNSLVYCRECYYRDCCLKESRVFKTCPVCEEER